MAQLLVTSIDTKEWYTPIANIRNYNEPDFEAKLLRYATDIFQNYYVISFKYALQSDDLPGKSLKPDLLLISKFFNKWVLLEVELCKNLTNHTKDQITCFSNPNYRPKDIVDYIMGKDRDLIKFQEELLDLVSNKPPELLIVMDDYSSSVFQNYKDFKRDIKICVMEIYKCPNHNFESYRFGGDYPYELTLFTKLTPLDEQHYIIVKTDIVKDLPAVDTEFELYHNMVPIKGLIIKATKNKYYLKLPNHNFPLDLYLQLGIDVDKKIILQKL